jgi:hypothetical protein
MVKVFRVLITGVVSASASAVMAAAPAQADEATYLHRLQPTYTSLSTRQLLAEGYRVCKADRGGMNSADAVKMVFNDLDVSVAAATDIVPAAVEELRC